MDKSRDITITVSADEKTGHEALYELLLVRNDVDRDRVFYKINGTTLLKFKELASTAGSPLLYFNIQPRDAGKIIWSHNTDTWELLNKAVNGNNGVFFFFYLLFDQWTCPSLSFGRVHF